MIGQEIVQQETAVGVSSVGGRPTKIQATKNDAVAFENNVCWWLFLGGSFAIER